MILPTVRLLLAVTFTSPVWAQTTLARCAAGFDWNKNSFGQDPCTVGSILDASCRGLTEYTYPPLTDSTQDYVPPRANHFGDAMCDCNTVMYSLHMACASCQGGQIYSWKQWIPECASVYVSHYPETIPPGTAVPRWAYFDITTLPDQTWNDSVATSPGRYRQDLLKRVDSVPPPQPSDPPSPAQPSNPPPPPQPSDPPPSQPSDSPDAPPSDPKTPDIEGKHTSINTPSGLPDATVPPPDTQQPTNPVANANPPPPMNPPNNPNAPSPTNPPANPPAPANPPNNANPPATVNPPANSNPPPIANPPANTNAPGPTNPSDNTNPPVPTPPAGNTDTPGPGTPVSDSNNPGPATPASDSNSPGPATPANNGNSPGPATPASNTNRSGPATSTTSANRPGATLPTGSNNNSPGLTNVANTNGGIEAWAIVVVPFLWALV